MASIGAAEQLPLWITAGAHGVISLVFVVWLTLRVTAWRLDKPLQDLTTQSVLYNGLVANFTVSVLALCLALNQFLFARWDGVVVSYVQWLLFALVFMVMTRMISTFLAMNRVWNKSLPKLIAASMLALLACTFVGDSTRYLWFAVHLVVLLFGVHAMWVYRERSDSHALLVLALVQIFWVAGFSLPFLLGHAALQVISFACELWWYCVASWISIGLLSLYVSAKLYRLGKDLEEYLQSSRYKWFRSRTSDAGVPGEAIFVGIVDQPAAVVTSLDPHPKHSHTTLGAAANGTILTAPNGDRFAVVIANNMNESPAPVTSSSNVASSNTKMQPHLYSVVPKKLT